MIDCNIIELTGQTVSDNVIEFRLLSTIAPESSDIVSKLTLLDNAVRLLVLLLTGGWENGFQMLQIDDTFTEKYVRLPI